jgi:hypothetical protein
MPLDGNVVLELCKFCLATGWSLRNHSLLGSRASICDEIK